MTRKLIVAIAVIGAIICRSGNAFAQRSSSDVLSHLTPVDGNGAATALAESGTAIVRPVDTGLFRKSHPALTLREFPILNGQIPDYGGPLQNYLNTETTHPLHDVIRPFGASGIFSGARRRLELFGDIGGVYVPFRSVYTMPNAWLTQAGMGARVALDQGHRFWVGGTASYLADFADKKRQSGSLSADFTFRSGR